MTDKTKETSTDLSVEADRQTLEAELVRTRNLLEKQREGHALVLAQTEARYNALADWAKTVEDRINQTDAELAAVYSSTSWRVTAPIRKLRSLISRAN